MHPPPPCSGPVTLRAPLGEHRRGPSSPIASLAPVQHYAPAAAELPVRIWDPPSAECLSPAPAFHCREGPSELADCAGSPEGTSPRAPAEHSPATLLPASSNVHHVPARSHLLRTIRPQSPELAANLLAPAARYVPGFPA